MKCLNYILFFFLTTAYAQDSIQAALLKSTPLKVQTIVGIDNFGTLYYTNDGVFYKKDNSQTINYSNIQLGKITSANSYNPLKMVLFYQDFNTAIVLDNRLAEIYKIDFNITNPYKNASHISIGNDNTLWLFNQDIKQLELYDYKANLVRAKTLPVVSRVLDLKSNYNHCWLLTEKYLYKYNYFGSLLFKIKNQGYTAIAESNDNLIIKQGNQLLFLNDKTEAITPIKTSELLINQFLVTAETLYIYDSEFLHEFQLKK